MPTRKLCPRIIFQNPSKQTRQAEGTNQHVNNETEVNDGTVSMAAHLSNTVSMKHCVNETLHTWYLQDAINMYTIESEVNGGTVSMKRSALGTCKMQSKCKRLKQQKSVTALCQWHLRVVARFWFQLTPQHREHVEMNPTLKLSRRGVGAMSQLMLYFCKLFL